ncbi:restriction endonuclease [Brevibacillus porteri]|uniref:restriction endonuclease n=1 Tax=Brevibacillus porteri TaxID=2126350 RepID=UPI003D24E9E6
MYQGGGSITFFIIVVTLLLALFAVLNIYKQRARKQRIKKIGMSDIDRMDGHQFEQYLALLFSAIGYSVQVTPASRDYGADLIIAKNSTRIAVQAKRQRNAVGIGAVQEVSGAKAYYNTDQAWILTNDRFTSSAVKLARSANVMLYDRSKLMDFILQIHPDLVPIPRNILQGVPAKEVICQCGEKMIKRKGPSGQFWGCKGFPKCRYTQPIR